MYTCHEMMKEENRTWRYPAHQESQQKKKKIWIKNFNIILMNDVNKVPFTSSAGCDLFVKWNSSHFSRSPRSQSDQSYYLRERTRNNTIRHFPFKREWITGAREISSQDGLRRGGCFRRRRRRRGGTVLDQVLFVLLQFLGRRRRGESFFGRQGWAASSGRLGSRGDGVFGGRGGNLAVSVGLGHLVRVPPGDGGAHQFGVELIHAVRVLVLLEEPEASAEGHEVDEERVQVRVQLEEEDLLVVWMVDVSDHVEQQPVDLLHFGLKRAWKDISCKQAKGNWVNWAQEYESTQNDFSTAWGRGVYAMNQTHGILMHAAVMPLPGSTLVKFHDKQWIIEFVWILWKNSSTTSSYATSD